MITKVVSGNHGYATERKKIRTPRRRKLPKHIKEQVIRTYGDRCWLCKELIRFTDLTVDHVKPVSHGGTDVLGNLRPAHKRCNSARGNRAKRTKEGGYVR